MRSKNPEVGNTPVTQSLAYSKMDLGLGRTGLDKFLGNINMKPLARNYSYYQSLVTVAAKKKATDIMTSATPAIKQLYSATNGVYNIRVIYDGSWQKRGHTSNLAMGAVIEAETGLVIDYETMSKYCEKCTKKENAVKRKTISKEAFEEWLEGHKSAKIL